MPDIILSTKVAPRPSQAQCTVIVNGFGTYVSDFSSFDLRLVVRGVPCSLKNSKRLVRAGGRVLVVPSSKAGAWLRDAEAQLRHQWELRKPIPKSIHLHVQIVSYFPTRRLTDLDNTFGGPLDALQRAGVIEDDSAVCSLDGSRRMYDATAPRVEITLTRFTE